MPPAPPPDHTDSHKQRTLSGIAWNFLRVFSQTFLGLGIGIALARLLPPADFGLLALAMVFIGLAELVSSLGMGPAVIRFANLTERHLRVALTLSLLMGGTLVVLFWLLADQIAALFGDERVADVLRILSVGLGFSALAAVSRGLMLRALDFKRLFKIEAVTYLVGSGAVSITLAVLGYGVWSLVIGAVVTLALSAIALLIARPPKWGVSLSRPEVRDLLGFGSWVSLNNFINYLAANVDYLAIGKFLSPALLGLYSRAYQLVTLPLNKIAATLSAVLFPSYSEIQHDLDKLRRAYLKAVNATALITFPILAGMAVAAETVITGLYGDNWREASAALGILSVAGMLKAVFHLAGPVAQATGHIYAEVKRQAIYLGILSAGCLAAVSYGIEAVAWAVVLGSLWLYLSMAQLAGKILSVGWGEFFKSQLPGLAVAAIVSLMVVLTLESLSHWDWMPTPVRLIIVVAVAGLSFLVCFFYLPGRIVGEMPAWLCLNYANRLPAPARDWLVRHFSRAPRKQGVP